MQSSSNKHVLHFFIEFSMSHGSLLFLCDCPLLCIIYRWLEIDGLILRETFVQALAHETARSIDSLLLH